MTEPRFAGPPSPRLRTLFPASPSVNNAEEMWKLMAASSSRCGDVDQRRRLTSILTLTPIFRGIAGETGTGVQEPNSD